MKKIKFDVLIIGSGTAGLMCGLELPLDKNIAIITKKAINDNCSFQAQGGMSVAFGDDKKSHILDTIKASDGMADEKSVQFLVNNSKPELEKLADYGVKWTKYKGAYHLTNEGGHNAKRIAHIKDHSGKTIHQTLEKVAKSRKNIKIFTNYIVVDLLTQDGRCGGVYALNDEQEVLTFLSKNTILATGGASKVYKYTTNPDTSTGDGIAMAFRGGCDIINMEFSQFHPTCLYHQNAKSFLISEALRGEGAKLVLPNGKSFMEKYDSRCELASRDIVARAIDSEMKKHGFNCVYLDISFMSEEKIIKYFPTIYHRCLEFNIDITREKIPVVPAAHYTCGGIKTDLNGKTNINNLYAIGEVAHTGVHGANRLASNSLLECVVFASSTAAHIAAKNNYHDSFIEFKSWDKSRVVDSNEQVIVSHLWDEVRLLMWNYVGIVRSNSRLKYAKKHLDLIKDEVNDYYTNYLISSDLIELRNLVLCASIIVESAIQRKESRGLHYNLDFLEKSNEIKNTCISR